MVLAENRDLLKTIQDLERTIHDLERRVKVKGPHYSPMRLKSYDRERHLEVNVMYTLLQEQKNLSPEKLSSAIAAEQIRVYTFKGKQYLDRLDVGRIYHQEKEKPSGLTIER